MYADIYRVLIRTPRWGRSLDALNATITPMVIDEAPQIDDMDPVKAFVFGVPTDRNTGLAALGDGHDTRPMRIGIDILAIFPEIIYIYICSGFDIHFCG